MDREIIKKTIQLVPNADYNLMILLTGSIRDFGVFDTFIPVYGYGYYGNNFYDSEGLGLDNLLP